VKWPPREIWEAIFVSASVAAPTPPGSAKMVGMQPELLAANTFGSFYAGSGRIAAFRRDPGVPGTDPEDWIASDTERTGQAPLGLTRLADGALLRDRFAADPAGWFGSEHVRRHGSRSGLLVKLLDAGQRLPLHLHPTRDFAREHLTGPYGKTEAWIVLDAEPDATVHLGFSRDVTADELAGWVRAQDVEALLGACNLVPVQTGDVLLCPAGVPHAIGAGILVVELQEPTDFSLMLEWSGFQIPSDAVFLGLDQETAMSAVRRSTVAPAALAGERLADRPGVTSLMPAEADAFFRAEQIVPGPNGEPLDPGFCVLVVCDGVGTLGDIPVAAGQTWAVPHAAGRLTLTGDVVALRCRPV
jgi:mannose-6-phosphate isomerase